jgi:hypothetical protein
VLRLLTAAFGTKRTCGQRRVMSALGGQSGHRSKMAQCLLMIPKRTLGEEATATLEPFAACQHLFGGLLAVRGISKCVASSFGRWVAREHSRQ